ncbi:hypothetical protein [Ralstonia solanacearum]|uniref:ATP-binding protein n=1 Tax=Ralstonia solanacearum TaxID=305 RepID=A0AAD0S8Y9_RALSL|nr:hypothetical protein [Ralstonia solanacearum]AXV82859.1 hypothetical protein CJO77_15690 [Ralstonia solanacearum]AXW53977.1 hypothetical protein CJO92_15695 [Ralstonia solanacearum]
MISFSQNATVSNIEEALGQIQEPPNVVRVPVNLRYGGTFGITGALAQFLATWSRSDESAELKLYGNAADADATSALAQEPHGICALYFAKTLAGPTGQQLDVRQALERSVPRILAMQDEQYRDTMGSRGVFLGCFARAKNEFLSPLYATPKRGALLSRSQYVAMTTRAISSISPTAAYQIGDENLAQISHLVFELFKNTDEHGMTDPGGKLYSRNVRGVLFKHIALQHHVPTVGRPASGFGAAMAFVSRVLESKRKFAGEDGKLHATAQTPFIEINVFDTGLGLAKRFSGRDQLEGISVDDEVDIVKRCFQLHETSKEGVDGGSGLTAVLQVLKHLKAFLSLRTGRVHLYQDFSSARAGTIFEPKHWNPSSKQMEEIAGASYSIVIPASQA